MDLVLGCFLDLNLLIIACTNPIQNIISYSADTMDFAHVWAAKLFSLQSTRMSTTCHRRNNNAKFGRAEISIWWRRGMMNSQRKLSYLDHFKNTGLTFWIVRKLQSPKEFRLNHPFFAAVCSAVFFLFFFIGNIGFLLMLYCWKQEQK